MKNIVFWCLTALLILFALFLTASLLFVFYPEAFKIGSENNRDKICPVEQFPCGNSIINGTDKFYCLDRHLHCNGQVDCPNGEDELNCVDNSGRIGKAFLYIVESVKNGTKLPVGNSPKHCSIEMYFKGECSCNLTDDKIVFCENNSLDSIPENLNRNITKLVLSNNTISELNVTILSQYIHLESLYLDNNNISELKVNSFRKLKKLKNLSIRNNKLRVISRHHFSGLNDLKMLYLENNQIISFDLSSLSDTPVLQLLVIGNNHFNLEGQQFPPLAQLSWIVLDNNHLTYIDVKLFRNLPKLKTLHIKKNRIKYISARSFANNTSLQELDLSENTLNSNINPDSFKGLHSLNKLDLKHNRIRSLPKTLFRELYSLESLDLRGITIDNIDLEHFSYCTQLQHIYFIRFRYCSYAPRVRICRPITDGLSSAEHLLVLPVLRYSVWVVALVTCVGNVVVLIWRSLSKKEDHVLSLFIKNLSAADLLMGIYLCAIGAHDLAFRDEYRRHALSWMSSWSCTTCGFMAMLSSQVSVFTLALITIERYRCITANFRVVTIFAAKMNLAAVWLLATVLAVYPVIYYTTTGDQVFYASNGLCFPLHIDDPYMIGWQYSALVFLGINFPAVLLIITLYLIMFYIIKRDRKHSRPVFIGRKREDDILALRFFGIVVTDCLCWIPIVVIKILALMQIPISSNIYAWVVVFVLPINSALNPIIYTLAAPTELRRRIIKWLQQSFQSYSMDCCLTKDSKRENNSSSMVSHTSLTLATTEQRSSNGSAVSLSMTLQCSSAHNRTFHQSIRTIRL